ncbi:MAG: radical SAM protein [Oscillospiraceae bacterium]|nr:radical SAM protein [Oscillospiraceae bacterium]
MKHANISIFIPHMGCPYKCAFCAQHEISSTEHIPTPDEVRNTIEDAFSHITVPEERMNTEIAFFGGSFTAIPRDYMISVLSVADEFIGEGKFRGIRISTRPDCIEGDILDLLKEYGVTAIELGAQSMDDDVLSANLRGHTSEDVFRASRLIRSAGFELGLQMMTGLYKASAETDLRTGRLIAEIHPDTVRIYPTVIIENTMLGRLYRQGKYIPYPFEDCIRVCAELYGMFINKDIRVIRLGLHAEGSLEKNMIGGYYHPALGELIRSEYVRQLIEAELPHVRAAAPGKLMSILTGHKRSNKICFSDKDVTFLEDDSVPKDHVRINGRLHRICL